MSKYKNKDGIQLSFTGKDEVTILVKEVIGEAIRILNRDGSSRRNIVLGIDNTLEAVKFLEENFDMGDDDEVSDS